MDGQPLEASRDIVLGKVDALEIRPSQGYFNSLRFLDWYRYLNCGYRLPCVGHGQDGSVDACLAWHRCAVSENNHLVGEVPSPGKVQVDCSASTHSTRVRYGRLQH